MVGLGQALRIPRAAVRKGRLSRFGFAILGKRRRALLDARRNACRRPLLAFKLGTRGAEAVGGDI